MWGPHLTQCPIAENGWIYFEMVFGFFLVLAPGLVMGPHVQTCPSQIWTSTYVCVSSPALGNQRQPSANTQKTDLEMSSCLENFVRNTPARTPATFFFILNISRQSGWFFVGEWFMQAVMGSDFVTGDCDEDEFPEMSQVLVRSWQVPRVFLLSHRVLNARTTHHKLCCAILFVLLVTPTRCQSQNYSGAVHAPRYRWFSVLSTQFFRHWEWNCCWLCYVHMQHTAI